MAERPTAGYDIHFDTDGVVGILLEFDEATEGDTEDISGTGNVENGIVRRKGVPVDKGQTITISGKLDDTAAGFTTFDTAMENRTPEVDISLLRSGDGWKYTGHAESYNKTLSRSEAVWNFSLTFYVNEKDEVGS
jgi:hypothetical protein